MQSSREVKPESQKVVNRNNLSDRKGTYGQERCAKLDIAAFPDARIRQGRQNRLAAQLSSPAA